MKPNLLNRSTVSALSLCFLLGSDWPRFRGPDGAGIADDAPLPAELGPGKNLRWTIQSLKGNSSPVVIGSRVFLTGHEGEERIVVAYDAPSGRELWRRSYSKLRSETFNPMNGPTTSSPVSDGQSLVVFFPEIGLLAFSLEGELSWQRPLGPFASVQGLASSPVIVDGKIVLLVDTPTEAFVQAFDPATGSPLWKRERPTGALGSYTTPTVYSPPAGSPQVVVAGATELTGYDVRTGERLWWAPGVASFPSAPPFVAGDSVYSVEPADGIDWPPFSEPLGLFDADRNGRIEGREMESDPIWARSLLGIDRNFGNGDGIVTPEEYGSAGGEKGTGGLVRTRLGGRGNVRDTHVVWRRDRGMPFLTGALLYRNVLYVVDSAVVSAFDPETGTQLRRERLRDALGDYYASPVAGDGKVYFASLEGKLTVLSAGADFRVLATGDLGETLIATPAISNGRIFVRTEKSLYCFALPSPS